MRPQRRLYLTLFASPVLLLAFQPTLFGKCGVERWSVKTGTDSDSGLVDLSSSTPTTITDLRNLASPRQWPPSNRVQPTETTVWVINATLKEYARERDQDYHLVLINDAGNTMIVEIPDPNCVSAGSPFRAEIANARSEFDAQFTVSSSFRSANVPVQVKGVGMFDFVHSPPQRGVAPNAIELHPVLDIVFSSSGDFTIATSSAHLSVPVGGNASSTISVNNSGGFSSTISLSASGLPSGTTASFSPPSLTSGAGSSNLAISADATSTPGAYTANITGSGGGKTHSTTLTLTVVAPTDITPPITSITFPAAGASISGMISVTATASDNVAVSKLELYIDGVLKACSMDSNSLTYSWDSTKVINGSHTLSSKAYDAAGNVGTSSTVTIVASN